MKATTSINLFCFHSQILLAVMTLGMNSGTVFAYDWVQWSSSVGGNDHWYALTLDWGTWLQCEAEAVATGGHLSTINDSAENDWLTNFITDIYARNVIQDNHNGAWIGLEHTGGDIADQSSWEWVNGETLNYGTETIVGLTLARTCTWLARLTP